MANITAEEFEQFRAEVNDRYEQTRKLLTVQSVAIEQKLRALSSELSRFVSRRPDPNMVRDFWIRQVPKMMDQLKAMQIELAKMKAGTKEAK